MLTRAGAFVPSIAFLLLPLFPSFIMLTGVEAPGVSVLPRMATIGLFALVAALAVPGLCALARPPYTRVPLLYPLLGWLGAAFVAAAFGFDPAAGAIFLGIYALGIVWHSLIMRFFAVPGAARAIVWSFVVSGAAASVTALLMLAFRKPHLLYEIAHGRAVGTFVLPGELAGYLIVFLPFSFAVALRARGAPLRYAAWFASIAGIAAFVLTFSRAGWIGLTAAAAAAVVWSGTIRRRYAPLILAAGVGAVLAVFNAHHNPAENFTRLSIWQSALEIIRAFPLTGVGPFDFARVYPAMRLPGGDAQAFHAHNLLLTIVAETGVIGAAAMLWVWWRFVETLRERLKTASPQGAALALALAAGLAGTWVQGLIDTVSVVIFGLWLPAMALALSFASHRVEEL